MMTPSPAPKSKILRQGLALTIFLLLGFTLQAQTPTTGSVRGTVTSADDGLPIFGVDITLTQKKGGGQKEALSNNDGQFAFNSLTPGKYKIAFESPGFKSAKLTFYVEADRPRDINMPLKLSE
ncbi:MAG: carboxypeptidase-like regulatory domain-containing protein [Bacteroidia bacterium]